MIHHLQMHVEPSSWAMLPPSGRTRDNNHRLGPGVNRHPEMVEENDVDVRKEEKKTGFDALVSGWLESEFEDFSAPQLGCATMSPDLFHNRQPESASDIMNY